MTARIRRSDRSLKPPTRSFWGPAQPECSALSARQSNRRMRRVPSLPVPMPDLPLRTNRACANPLCNSQNL